MIGIEPLSAMESRKNGSGAICGSDSGSAHCECRCPHPSGRKEDSYPASRFSPEKPVRVMVVDDSELIRRALRKIFSNDAALQVTAEAANGIEALELLEDRRPDVITLDVHMPEMDGISTLKRIMIRNPRPTVMLSSLTLEGAKLTFDTLRYGAVDFLPKPSNLAGSQSGEQRREIIRRVRLAADVEIEALRYFRGPVEARAGAAAGETACRRLLVAGAAEGGYASLLKMIPGLPADTAAACVVVLHADPRYVDAFSEYLDGFSSVRVCRAMDGMPLQNGVCYLVAGCEYATLQNARRGPVLAVNPAPFQRRRGAIDMLMISAAEAELHATVGILLSGAGEDGVEGAGVIRRSGGRILIQDPVSCLYKQMAAAAIAAHGRENCTIVTDTAMADAVLRCAG
jgi:two-component system chemotaxis response regulator CheB